MNRSVIDWPTGVTVYHPDRCYNGYTLVHGRGPWDPVRGISAKQVDRWHLIDMKGQVVHEFYGNPATQRGSQLFERVANGHYISNGASITEQDWDGNIVWSLSSDFRRNARPTGFHHDIQKTSEYTYLAMVADRVDAPQVSRVTLKGRSHHGNNFGGRDRLGMVGAITTWKNSDSAIVRSRSYLKLAGGNSPDRKGTGSI